MNAIRCDATKCDSISNDGPLMKMASAARAAMADPARTTIVGNVSNPRFELFHAASSLCSQKVRTVLHEKQLPYRSNDMLILSSMGPEGLVPAEHYSPAYVRLRLVAGRELGREFVKGYSGRTSVETEGFDPCVVPLLVDHQAGRVIADSLRICAYLDSATREPIRLVPDDSDAMAAEVMRQVGIVDRIPNTALLYGFHPDADMRPEALKSVMETVYEYKIQVLEGLIAANADEPELVAAYRAKIAKESGGLPRRRDAEFQRAARHHTRELLEDLDRDLDGQSPYLMRSAFSLADVVWGVNLVRVAYLGLASLWDGLPNVSRYFDALVRRPSLYEEAIKASIRSLPHSSPMDALVR